MLAWDYEVHSQEYDPRLDRWSEPAKMPLEFSECYPDTAAVGELAFAFFRGQAALYQPARGGWTRLEGGMLESVARGTAYREPPKLWRFAQLAAADDVLFLLAEGITVASTGEACFGCPGSPVSLWAYRPE